MLFLRLLRKRLLFLKQIIRFDIKDIKKRGIERT